MGTRGRIGHVARTLRERYALDFVFVHINKTGGSSVAQALGLPVATHQTALEKRAQLGTRFDARFKFAFVRNPWDKVLSHYAYRVMTNQTGLGEGKVDFTTWVRRAYGEHDPLLYDKPKMFMQQTEWLSDSEGHNLMDFVGRFERLEADFKAVCSAIGRQAELPHVKGSRHGPYRDAYDRVSADIIASAFQTDIESFDYNF
jgi:Sulfotransferase family